MLSLAMETLHFGSRVSNLENGENPYVIKEELKGLKKNKNINHHCGQTKLKRCLRIIIHLFKILPNEKWGKQRIIG